MGEYTSECQAANRIAAELRGQKYQRVKAVRPVIPSIRATAVVRGGRHLVTAKRVYEFIVEFFRENDQLPSSAHIGDGLDICPQAANGHMKTLARLGYIEKNTAGKYRFARETVEA
jgi:hypothetical protein